MTTSLKEILLSADPVQVLKALKGQGKLADLEPFLAALEMKIPAGYRHKDNLEHSFQVLQNAIDREVNGPDLVLRTAALFHDIGKPKTREFGPKGVVTFTNHDLVGANIVRRILPKHNYSKEDVDKIARIVLLHMRSHTFKTGWSESAVRRLATDAGSNLQLERLIVVFYSDATTKFDTKKSAIHNNVTELAEELDRVKKSDARAALRPALNGNEVAEFLNLTPGRELGVAMRLLNSDEYISLTREESFTLLRNKFLA
jgi:poly(A) polymerase